MPDLRSRPTYIAGPKPEIFHLHVRSIPHYINWQEQLTKFIQMEFASKSDTLAEVSEKVLESLKIEEKVIYVDAVVCFG